MPFPNKATQFTPNDPRINRTGQNRGSRHRSTIAREWLETKVDHVNPLTGQVEEAEIEVHGTLELVGVMLKSENESAKMQAYEKLMDSAYGKPNQPVENTNIDGTIVKIGGEEAREVDGSTGAESESPTT